MDSSVTPTSPSEMAILVAGLLIMLFGVYKVYRERGRPGLLILWGGLVDLGLALMGLGLGPSGDVGSIMIVIYHAIARLAAWIGLSGTRRQPVFLRRQRHPRRAAPQPRGGRCCWRSRLRPRSASPRP